MLLFLCRLKWSVPLLLKHGVGKDNSAYFFLGGSFMRVQTEPNESPGSVK